MFVFNSIFGPYVPEMLLKTVILRQILKLCDFGTAVRLSPQRPRSTGRAGLLERVPWWGPGARYFPLILLYYPPVWGAPPVQVTLVLAVNDVVARELTPRLLVPHSVG